MIVYADDFIAGFQYKWEAEKYYGLLKERMEKFGLELEESKSRMLESGGYPAKSKQKRGESTRLETFDFLGFTFYCGRTRKGTAWMIPKTSSKKFEMNKIDIKGLLLRIFIPTIVLCLSYFVLGHFCYIPYILLFCIQC